MNEVKTRTPDGWKIEQNRTHYGQRDRLSTIRFGSVETENGSRIWATERERNGKIMDFCFQSSQTEIKTKKLFYFFFCCFVVVAVVSFVSVNRKMIHFCGTDQMAFRNGSKYCLTIALNNTIDVVWRRRYAYAVIVDESRRKENWTKMNYRIIVHRSSLDCWKDGTRSKDNSKHIVDVQNAIICHWFLCFFDCSDLGAVLNRWTDDIFITTKIFSSTEC